MSIIIKHYNTLTVISLLKIVFQNPVFNNWLTKKECLYCTFAAVFKIDLYYHLDNHQNKDKLLSLKAKDIFHLY